MPRSPTPFADYVAEREREPSAAKVFPCAPNGKTPACLHGLKDATADMDQLRAWASENPAYNVALDPHSVGLCVVDIDGQDGETNWLDLELTRSAVPDTATVKTPRGGRHLYFRGVLPSTASKLAQHVDTRGGGAGYVLLPPSVVDGKAYAYDGDCDPAELPDWIAEEAGRKHERVTAASDVALDQPGNVARAITHLKNALPAIEGQGGDACTYALACAVLNLGVSPERAQELMEEHWNPRCEPPWEPDELATKIANAAAYAQNEAGAWAVGSAQEVFKDALDKLSLPEDPAPARSYPLPMSAAELAAGTFPRAEHLIERFLLKDHVNLLYGDGGTGKTLLSLTWAVHIAAGQPWSGLVVQQAPALILLAEDDNGETKARLEAICAALGVNLADLPVHVWCLPGHDVNLARIQDDGQWEPGPFLEPLKDELERIGPCFLVMDTVSDIATLDETKRLPVNALCKAVLTGLCRDHGATVLVNAHPSKAAMNDGSGYAGSTAWNNAVRNRLTLSRDDERSPRRVLRLAKANYGQEGEVDLFLSGATFSSGAERTAADRTAALMDACVRVAIMAANTSAPMRQGAAPLKWQIDEIEKDIGRRPTKAEIKETLAAALPAGLLRYIKGTNTLAAGYYPSDMAVAEELARDNRRAAESARKSLEAADAKR